MISITARTELRSPWPQTAPSRLAGPQPWNHCFLAVENEGKVFRKLENLSVVEPALAGLHPLLLDRGPTWLMVRSPPGARGPPRNHPDTLSGDPALARLSRMSHFLSYTQPFASDSLSSGILSYASHFLGHFHQWSGHVTLTYGCLD